jgi:glycosyltransferase involved in cell wall biosynthesis
MQKNKILIVSITFAPRLSVASLRLSNFAKEFEKLGWEVHVITCKHNDGNNMLDLPISQENITYINYFDIFNLINRFPVKLLAKILKKIISFFISPIGEFYPDLRYYFWRKKALKTALKIIDTNEIQHIYSSYSAVSSHLLGQKIKENRPEVKWIAEYRDLWSLNHGVSGINKYFRNFQLKIEKQTVSKAQHLVTVSKGLAEELSKALNRKVEVIYNGCDLESFKTITPYHFDQKTIVYTGGVYKNNYDFDLLIDGLTLFVNKYPDFNFQLLFVGTSLPLSWKSKTKYKQLQKYIKIKSKQNHHLVLSMQMGADVLLQFLWRNQEQKGILSGKIFEYIASGTPIITIGKGEEVEELIDNYSFGYFGKTAESILLALEDAFKENKINNQKDIQDLTKANQVVKITSLFNAV